MTPRVLSIDARAPEPAVVAEAARVLRAGGLVAFPTETVYGLGGLADDTAAIERIYAAKGRPRHNPLIAHVATADAARSLAAAWPDAAAALAAAFWPGPLTLVVPRGPTLPASLSAGRATFAVRVPDHAVALALLTAVGRPIAAPSANPSQRLSPTTAAHVVAGLGDRVDLVLDGGPCRVGIESTVVDVTGATPCVLRPGGIDLATLRAVVADVTSASANAHGVAPGQDRVHYAPRVLLRTVARAALPAAVAAFHGRCAVLTRGTPIDVLAVVQSTLPDDPVRYAQQLFAALHALDAADVAAILVEAVPASGAWAAVHDRLARAAAGEPV